MSALTHQFLVLDSTGDCTVHEARLGFTFAQAVADLAEGQLPFWLTLVSVRATDFDASTVADVTARALHEVAAHVEADERELPANLRAAFAAYDVPVPQAVPADWADAEAEHRLTSADYGIVARAV